MTTAQRRLEDQDDPGGQAARRGCMASLGSLAADRVRVVGVEISPIRYADAGGVEIAYQVIGNSGPVLIGTPGFASNIELMWEEPRAARFLRRLGSFSRFIHYDKRGTGMSDRQADLTSFPERVADMTAVMDAESVEQAFIAGFSDGGTMSAFFAATYPERTPRFGWATRPRSGSPTTSLTFSF